MVSKIIKTFSLTLTLIICSQSLALVGGNESKRDYFPATINFRSVPVECGGVVISKNKILTAAHCVFTTPSAPYYKPGYSLEFRAGDDNGLSPRFLLARLTVREVIVHPSYLAALAKVQDIRKASQVPEAYDLAVILFNEDIPFSIATLTEPTFGKVTYTGGGCTFPNGPGFSLLRWGELSYSENVGVVGVAKSDLNPQTSSCEGDSGSAVYQNKKVVGIARGGSAAQANGHSEFNVFTLIDFDWLAKF